MSAKSTAQPTTNTRSPTSKKLILTAVLIIGAVFFTIVTCYPLQFNSESNAETPGQKPPTTEIK